MNLHPLLVHFPVALLSIYCFLEIFLTFFYKDHAQLLWVKKWTLWIGTLSLFPALWTGDAAQDIVGKSEIVHFHEEIAEVMKKKRGAVRVTLHRATKTLQDILIDHPSS